MRWMATMSERVWTTRQLAGLVPGARVTQPAVPGVYGERVLTVVRLIQDSAYAGGWAVNARPESAGGVAIAALDPESVVATLLPVLESVACKCGGPGAMAECPFQSEINDDCAPCTCCDGCRHECAMEI